MRRIPFPLLAVCAALVGVAFAVAGAASAEGAVPFEASYSGTASVSAGRASSIAFGEATHLGNSSETISVALTPVSPLCQTNVGTGVLIAADGDQLFVAASGMTCFDPSTRLVDLTVTQTIIGGTGRFAGASGTLTVSGTANPATGTLTYTLEGTLS
jgi:hypothetical protein